MVNVATILLRHLFGATLPAWVGTLLADVLVAGWSVVGRLKKSEMKGAEKRAVALASVGGFADEAFDEVPGWRDIDEEARDRIIEGLIELVYQASKAQDHSKVGRKRRALAHAKIAASDPVGKPKKKRARKKKKDPEATDKTDKGA